MIKELYEKASELHEYPAEEEIEFIYKSPERIAPGICARMRTRRIAAINRRL